MHRIQRPSPLLLVLAALLLGAPSAAAAPTWRVGTSETSQVGNCDFALEPGIQANAELLADEQAIPRVGEVFYVRSVIARIGQGCDIEMAAHVEIVAPEGVTPAISAEHPVRCQWVDILTDATEPASGCPQEAYEGVYGPAFDQLTPGGPDPTYPWVIPYPKALVVEVPLRSSRALQGTNPGCERVEGMPPCRPAQSGDTLQFTVRMLDAYSSAWLSPYVPLFVHDGGPSGAGAPAAGALASAPASTSPRRLRRGLSVPVAVPAAGSRVQARLTAGGRTLASAKRRRASAGTTTLRVRARGRGAAALRRARLPLRATLSVRVTPPGGPARTETHAVSVVR